MTKHATGPWLIVPHPERGVQCVAIVDGNRDEDMRDFADGFAVLYCEDGVRNADVIAAAPDLYDALRWLIDEVVDEETSGYLLAVCALAKARGEP